MRARANQGRLLLTVRAFKRNVAWLYGPTQAHPFSVANVPSDNEHNELRFVMRIHDGLMRARANQGRLLLTVRAFKRNVAINL
jgi:hypothetical protein